MSRVKIRQLRGLLNSKIKIINLKNKEIKKLRKIISELEASCENFAEIEVNLHKENEELKKSKNLTIKEKIKKIFS